MTQQQTIATDRFSNNGFSLVELSIVLVILGLLVGGILGGQSLIRAAELRNITVEHQQWQTAVNTFRQKYHALPGDMPNATRFWGVYSNCSAWQLNSEKPTCNGNGSGNFLFTTNPATHTIRDENILMWQHLANAGLLTQQRVNRAASANKGVASRIGGVIWMIQSTHHLRGQPYSAYVIAREFDLATATSFEGINFLSVAEAWGIDNKLDDGKPFSGSVFTMPGTYAGTLIYSPNCTEMPDGSIVNMDMDYANVGIAPEVANNAQYKLGHSQNDACTLLFDF